MTLFEYESRKEFLFQIQCDIGYADPFLIWIIKITGLYRLALGINMTQFIPVLFGTETGNAADCADTLAIAITGAGFPAKSIDLYDFDCEDLCEQSLVFIVSSTHGNGDPPENAEEMMEFLKHDSPDLANVQFAVCALGDTAYPYFA